MSESMIVYVTQADLERIKVLYAEAELSRDDTKLVGFIQGCYTANGGDFSAKRARSGVNTVLKVIQPPMHEPIKLTIVSEEPIRGKEKG